MRYHCFKKSLGIAIARQLLEIDAIRLQPHSPFTWASGWKSPIYCDNRISLSFPKVRNNIKLAFCDLIKEYYPNAEVIAGVATAGIPQGALLADALGLPFIYVRSSSKSHGLNNQIEGAFSEGQKVVVLEDLISSGGSSLAAVNALRDKNIEVLGMTSIFNYGFSIAQQNFINKAVDLVYLSEYSLLIDLALAEGFINASDAATLQSWRISPETWSK
ncbi:MAG: orotate phosphoribosyltransferase [Flammeovirgaceae bacterium]|nr:orotate phosphoribosyltransferase [Flammeovirgaceae bacterium]|tara:strand:- start:1445 stop:2095 length:651 start_codon:yes stop_codon:yes gene_type:complete